MKEINKLTFNFICVGKPASQSGEYSFLTECQYLHQNNLEPFYHTLLKHWQEYNTGKFFDD